MLSIGQQQQHTGTQSLYGSTKRSTRGKGGKRRRTGRVARLVPKGEGKGGIDENFVYDPIPEVGCQETSWGGASS